MSFDLVHTESLPNLSQGSGDHEWHQPDPTFGFKLIGRQQVAEPLGILPENLAGEYFELIQVSSPPQGITYQAKDGLGEDVVITEIFDSALCLRDPHGTVTARPGHEAAWTQHLAETKVAIAQLSRLSHPALDGIDQVIHENGTIYIASAPDRGHALDHGAALSPAEIQHVSETLIDLLGYVHAFGVTDLKIRPDIVSFDDQKTSVSLPLRLFLDGTMPLPDFGGVASNTDCPVLAETLHVLITGQAPSTPPVPLMKRCPDYPKSFLAALDNVLSPPHGMANLSARDWAARSRSRGSRHQKTHHRLLLATLVFAVIVGAVTWYGSLKTDPPMPPVIAEQPVPNAGPWQVELPLKVIAKGQSFVLRMTQPSPEFVSINPWVQDGLIVTKIDGDTIEAPADLRDLLVTGRDPADRTEFTSLTISDPDLPLERTVAVVPYLWREKAYGVIGLRELVTPDGWQLVVTTVSDYAAISLRPGDVLLQEEVANQALSRLSDLERVLEGLKHQTHPSLTVLIRRDGSQLVVGFAAETLMNP